MTKNKLTFFLAIGTIPFLFGFSYLLNLFVGLPVFLHWIWFAIALFFLKRFLPVRETFAKERSLSNDTSWWFVITLGFVFSKLIALATVQVLPEGGWDAWGIWNLQARYLSQPEAWRNLYAPDVHSHTDYPKGLSATVAAFFYWTKSFDFKWALVLQFFYLLMTPVILALSLKNKSVFSTLLALIFLVYQAQWIQESATGYADVILSFHALGLFTALHFCKIEPSKDWAYLAGLLAALCFFTKNEGALFVIVGLLFYGKSIFKNKLFLPVVIGFLPLMTLWVWEFYFHQETNDLIKRSGSEQWAQLFDPQRYQLIWTHFKTQIAEHFQFLKLLFFIVVAYCILQKKWPDRIFLSVLVLMFFYTGVYLLTPLDLDWQIRTSINRLLVQLVPMFIFGSMLTLVPLFKFNFVWKRTF